MGLTIRYINTAFSGGAGIQALLKGWDVCVKEISSVVLLATDDLEVLAIGRCVCLSVICTTGT